MAYDIELKPKVVQTGDLEKLEKQIDAISNKSITLDVQVDSHGKSAKTIGELIDQASRVKTELQSMTKVIKVDVDINDVENRVHDMLAKLSQLSRYNGKDVSIGLRLGAANESALKPNQIDRLIGQAEKIQTLRSGKKNLALSVDTSQIGNQIDEALNLIQEKFATATTSINTSAVTSGIEEGAKKAGLSLRIDTPIDTSNLKALLDQVDRIVALSPDTIEKKVSLEVNSGEFLNQMKEAMAKLEAIDPELVSNRKATLNRYNDLYEEYTKERKEFQNSLNSFEEMDVAPGTKEFSKKLEKIQNQASALYNTMQKLENLLGKNEFLYEQPNLPGFTDEEVIEPLEKLKSQLITVAEIESEDADKLASFKEQLQNLEITKKPVEDLDEELKNMATSINGTNTAARGSLEIINAINSAISKLATRMGALVKASETMRSGLGEATRNLNITLGTLAEYLKNTQENGVTPINNALDTTAQKTEEINNKFANLDNSLERLSKAYATLKSPFDLNDFATVNRLLGGFQSKLEELVTNYSDTKIKLTIESNDALQSLNDAANNVKKMVEAQKVFEKWLGKYQNKHPISEDTYANIGGAQAVADALSKYNQIINGEKKEVSLQFNTVGLNEVISDYNHIKDKNVEIGFTLSNAEAVGNTIDNLRNANVEVNQGGGISISLNEGALSSVNTNIANVIKKLEEIRVLLPTLKFETKQGEDNDTPDLLTPLEEIRLRIQSIDSKILAADTSNTGDKSSVISQYMSLINDLNSKITSKDNAANETDGQTKIVSAINEGVKLLQSELVKAPISIDNVNNSINSKSDKIITLLDTISKKRGSIGSDESKNKKDKISTPNAKALISNLTQAANIKSSVDTRVKELQRVLGIMDGGVSSDIFGSRQDIEAYITSLKTLNGEIVSATKILNRAGVSSVQQKEAQNKIATNTRAINGIINGNYKLGISPAKIKNINTLLESMATINERIGSVDPALQGLSKLKETLEKYGVEIQPLNDAVTALKSNRERMDQLIQSLNNPNLRTTELNKIRAELETNQADFQALIENAKSMLNREQKDSLSSISADFVEAEKEIDKYKTKIDSLKTFLSSLKKKGQDLSAFDMGNGKSAKDLQTFINTYEQFINSRGNLNDAANMQAFANNFRTNYQQPLDQYISTLSDANRRWSELNASAVNSMQALSFDKRLADFTTRVEKWKNNYGNALKDADLSEAFNKIYSQLANGAVTTDEQLKKLQVDLAQLTLRANQAGVASKNLTTKLKEMFKKYGGWTLVTRTLNYAMRLLRSMVTQVKEVDTAMTNLRKVTEATGRRLNEFLDSAGKKSVAVGASLTDYIDAVSEFSRLGKQIDEAQKLGELATTYKSVAEDLDIKTASQSLISTMQAFSSAGVQAEEIVDKFNYVGNNFAASSADIGVALQKSASALYGAQNTLSESVALITAGNEIVQNAEIIGTQLKTISARIRGTKDELGEDADDLVITTSKLRKELKALTGVDIMEDENRFKSTYQILKEISEVYNTLTDQKQSRVSELLGGKLGLNVVQSILGNFETAKQIVEELDEGLADNSASKELEKSLDSIQAKLNQLKSTWQQFSTDFLDTGFVKGFVDALKGLVSVLDGLTKITGKFSLASRAAFGAGLFANVLSKKQTGGLLFGGANGGVIGKTFLPGIQPQSLMSVYDYFNQSQKLKLAARQGKDLSSVTGVNAQLREFIQNTDQANVSISNFYASQTKSAKGFLGSIQAIRTYNNISEQNVAQRKAFAKAVSVSNEKLGQELQNLQGSNAGIRTYTKSLGGLVLKQAAATAATLAFNVAISVGVALIVQGISKLVNSYEEAQEKNAELIKSFKETSDSLQEERDNLEDLLSQYSNILVTTTDLASAQNQLIDIQEKITDVFGEEVDGLDLLNKSYGENIALIQKKRREDAKQFVDDKKNKDEYEAAQKYLEQEGTISENFAHFSAKNNATLIKAKGIGNFGGARKAILGENTVLSQWAGTIGVMGTAEQQVVALQRIYDNLSDLWADTDLDSNQRKWLRDIKDRIDELNNAIEESKRIISEWEIKQAIADSTDLSPETIRNIDKIEEAIALLQQANTSSDIIAASEQYQALKDSIYAAIPEEDEETRGLVDSYFEEIEKNIDQSILNIRDKGKVYEQTLKKFQDETYSAFSDGITKIDNALKTVLLGGSIDSSALLELAKIDSSLLGEFTKTADGYTLSIEALNKARKKLVEEQKVDVKDEIESNKKFIEDQKSLIEFYTKYDTNGFLINSKEREQAEEDKKDAEERLAYWETYLDLITRATDVTSMFQQAMSDIKGYKDNITALYSDEGIGDQFFIDHPELLLYKDDVEALANEIERIAHTNTSPVIEQLQQAIKEAQDVGDLESVIRYTSMLEQLTSEAEFGNLRTLEAQKKELREHIKQKELYIKGLERQKSKEEKILDSLNKQKEALESIASDYETAAKTAQDYIDDQIEALDKEIDKLEEHKKAIEDDFDARIQAIKDAIDTIEKESDALEKEAEMQERLNDLKEKELALEKARNQKVRVYTSERGWEIQTNSEEVAKAQKDYDEALKNLNKLKAQQEEDERKAALQAQIDQLEAEKEAALAIIDEQIKGIEAMKQEYEEYKKLWEDTLNAYQKIQDEMTAAAILGSDWREKIAEKDTEIVNTFAEKYNEVQEQIHGVIEKQIEDQQKLIDKYDEQINVQNDLKSAQEQYLGYYETYSKKYVDLTDAQTAALERLKNAIGAGDSEGALDAALNAENVLENNSQKKKTGVSSLDKLGVINKLMQTAPTSFTDGIVATVNAIKNLPNELKNIMNTNNSNNVNNDNRTQTININNPGFAMTMAEFTPLFTKFMADLARESQIGKK